MKKCFFQKIFLMLVIGILVIPGSIVNAQTSDTEPPADVDNVQAVPGDKKIVLTWDQATDNVGVTGYEIYMGSQSVNQEGKKYDLPIIDVSNVTTYEIKDLQNGTTYYFAVTAVDAAKNESLNYSVETSATPASGDNIGNDSDTAGTETPSNNGDTEAPTVASVNALNDVEVKVVFSEAVVLPAKAPENSFAIEDRAQGRQLPVISAVLDAKDSTEKTVLLSTEPQIENNSYLLTVGVDITDKAGNHVVSGVSDTAIFKGKAAGSTTEEETKESGGTEENKDTESPKIEAVKGLSKSQIQIDFSEELILDKENPQDGFLLYESADENIKIAIASATVQDNDKKVVILTTLDEMTGGTEYVLRAITVADATGNLIKEGFESTSLFTAPQSEIADLVPPEDVTNFIASLEGLMVKLAWTASINSAGDLVDQILYQSLDQGKQYDKGKSLGPTATSYEVKGLKTGKEYTFKLTVKDKTGNESRGVVTSVTLPQTGPEMIVLLLISSLGIGGYWVRRRK